MKGTIDSGEFKVVCVLQKIHPESEALLNGKLETDHLKVELMWKEAECKVKASESKGVNKGILKEPTVRFEEKVNNITTEQEI